MPNHRGLMLGAYLVAASLVFVPLLDVSLAITPMRVADFRWRFGAAGLLANAVIIPQAGVLLLLATAISHGHATFRRILGGLALVAAALWLGTMPLFVLDALQMRPSVRAEMQTSITVATGLAMLKMAINTTVMTVLGLIGIRASRSSEGASGGPELLVADSRKLRHSQ